MNTEEANRAPQPVTEPVDVAREELRTVDPQLMKAVEHSLREFQNALGQLQGWRASELWETLEEVQDVLGRGEFHAWEYPHKPKGFRHWREKYADRSDAPF